VTAMRHPRMRDDRLSSVVPTDEATDAYYDQLKAAFPGTIWVTGCQSWYLDDAGLPELWPWTPARHRKMQTGVQRSDFRTSAQHLHRDRA
jgi:hypothetical protein